jgi:hypothetical protein
MSLLNDARSDISQGWTPSWPSSSEWKVDGRCLFEYVLRPEELYGESECKLWISGSWSDECNWWYRRFEIWDLRWRFVFNEQAGSRILINPSKRVQCNVVVMRARTNLWVKWREQVSQVARNHCDVGSGRMEMLSCIFWVRILREMKDDRLSKRVIGLEEIIYPPMCFSHCTIALELLP